MVVQNIIVLVNKYVYHIITNDITDLKFNRRELKLMISYINTK